MMPSLMILIVDDEPSIRKTLAIALEAEGNRVVAVSNVKDALAIAQRVADSDATLLIGESGTGKTVLARAIHSWG